MQSSRNRADLIVTIPEPQATVIPATTDVRQEIRNADLEIPRPNENGFHVPPLIDSIGPAVDITPREITTTFDTNEVSIPVGQLERPIDFVQLPEVADGSTIPITDQSAHQVPATETIEPRIQPVEADVTSLAETATRIQEILKNQIQPVHQIPEEIPGDVSIPVETTAGMVTEEPTAVDVSVPQVNGIQEIPVSVQNQGDEIYEQRASRFQPEEPAQIITVIQK